MKPLLQISRSIDRLNQVVGRGVSWLVLVMVAIGGFNAIARYSGRFIGVNLSSNAWLELQWYLFSLIFLLAAADTLRRNAHVRVDVLSSRLSARQRAMLDVAGIVIFLLPFCAFGLWSSWPTVMASWHVLEGSPDPGGLPRYPIKSALLVSFSLLGLQALSELVKRVETLRSPEVET